MTNTVDRQQGTGKDVPVLAEKLQARAMRSSAWTMTEYLVNNVLRLGSNLVLAYALFPEAFAIVAYASIVLQGLQMLSDFGIGPAIVQNSRGADPSFLNTAWTFQVARGIVLFLVTALLGVPMAWFYNEPQLAWIVPACGLNFIVTGLQSTAVHTCSRALNLRRIAIWGVTEATVKAMVTIAWAMIWPSVWALVGGALVGYVVGCVMTHVFLPGICHRFQWDREAGRTLFRFGGWIMLSTMLTFFATQADRLILGKLVSMATVGVYSIALMFSRLPYEIGARLCQIVLFPALAEVARDDREALHAKFLKSRDAVLAICQLGFTGMIVGSPWFFEFLYDDRYRAAATFAPLLAATIWFAVLWASAYPALLAIGNARMIAASNFANLVVTVAGCIVGYQLGGMPGFIVGMGAGNAAGHAVVAWALVRNSLSTVAQDLRYTAVVGACALIGFGLPALYTTGEGLAWRLLLAVGGILLSAAYAWWRLESLAKGMLNMLFRRLGLGAS